MTGFSQQIGLAGGTDIPSASSVKQSTDYSGIVNTIGNLANRGLQNKAVSDFLGAPNTLSPQDQALPSISLQQDKSGALVQSIPEITGLNSIAQARRQGLSGSRAKVLADAKLSQALASAPQHRKAILSAYDNVVDPLGGRGASIFDPTLKEKQQAANAKDIQDRISAARKAGYANGDYLLYEQDLERTRLQIQQKNVEDARLSNNTALMQASADTLNANIYKGTTLLTAQVGAIISDNVSREGLLLPQVKADIISQITQQKRALETKIANFSKNPAFLKNIDKTRKRLDDTFKDLIDFVNTQDAGDVASALNNLAKNASNLELWNTTPNFMSILNSGGKVGLDILDTMNRVLGNKDGVDKFKENMNKIVNSDVLSKNFQEILQGKLKFANLSDPEDKKALSLAFAQSLNFITDKEDITRVGKVVLDSIDDKSKEIAKDPQNNVPPIDKPANPALATFLNPKLADVVRGEGRDKFVSAYNDSLTHMEEQIKNEGKGVKWEIAPSGNIIGFKKVKVGINTIGPMSSIAGSGEDYVRFHVQEDVLNKVIVPIMGMYPDVLTQGDAMSLPVYRKKLVDRLNNISNPPKPKQDPVIGSKPVIHEGKVVEKGTRVFTQEELTAYQAKVDEVNALNKLNKTNNPIPELDPLYNQIPDPKASKVTPDAATTTPLPDQPKAKDMTTLQDLSTGIKKAETGGLSDKFIRTLAPEQGTSSTAYGPLQLTYTTAKDIVARHKSLFSQDELNYVDRFIEQGKKFIKFGKEPNKAGYDKRYDYGGKGDLTSKADKEMYFNVINKMLKAKALDIQKSTGKVPSILDVIESWRGKTIQEDPNYYSKVFSTLPLVGLNDNKLTKLSDGVHVDQVTGNLVSIKNGQIDG